MTEKKFLLVCFFLMFCNAVLFAQSKISDGKSFIRPQIELIIGLNHPDIDLHIQSIDTPKNSDVNDGVTYSHINTDETDDNLEDLLDELEDEPPTEPAKEDLILVKQSFDLDLKMYPNPAKDYIKLQFDEANEYTVEIYDLIGNKVLSEMHSVKVGAELEFNLNNFQTGVYIMHINSNEAMTIKKFAIKH